MKIKNVILPAAGKKPQSAVLLLHGLGDSGAGLIDLGEVWRRDLPETVFLAPDAPEEYVCGYQWFSPNDWTPAVVIKGIRKAEGYLNGIIDDILGEYGLGEEKLALVGFSQGTMMSLHVAPRREKKLAGVLGYSGALVCGELLKEEMKSSPDTMLVHGMADDVVPFSAMAQAEYYLKGAGFDVNTLACPGLAHSINEKGLADGGRFLKTVLG